MILIWKVKPEGYINDISSLKVMPIVQSNGNIYGYHMRKRAHVHTIAGDIEMIGHEDTNNNKKKHT